METKNPLIERIVQLEWNMFQNVKNIGGGKASCQESPDTFALMRSSQFMSWPDDAMESYIIDLVEAKKEGRNLLTEKYARMMEFTSPLEYQKVIEHLPPEALEVKPLVGKIVKITLEWEKEVKEKYPNLANRSRPIYSSEDTPFSTSIETYLKGELSSYSNNTLELYYKDILKQKAKDVNIPAKVLEAQVKLSGYQSLEHANEVAKSR